MPLGKNLKKLQKRKGDTKLHPRGRKLKQLTTAELRQSKLEALKTYRDETQEKKMERHRYVQAVCDALQKEEYTMEDLRNMVRQFIDRDKPELEELEKERRPGRPPTNYHQKVKMAYESECKEFETGFQIVDITDPQTCKNLSKWTGTWGGLNNLKMTRVKPV